MWRTIRAGAYTILLGLLVTASGLVPPAGLLGCLIVGPLLVLAGLWVIGGGIKDGIGEWRVRRMDDAAWLAHTFPTPPME